MKSIFSLRGASSVLLSVSMVAMSFVGILTPSVAFANVVTGYSITGGYSTSGTSATLSGTAHGVPDSDEEEGDPSNENISVDWTGACAPESATSFSFDSIVFQGEDDNGKFFDATWSTSHNFGAPGSYPVCVRVYQTNLDGDEDANTATYTTTVIIPPQPIEADIVISKTVDNATPNVGDTVTYTLTVGNSEITPENGVIVTDILPAGLTFVSTSTSDTVGIYNSSTGVWTVGTLGATSSATLHIKATVNTGTGGQTITNTATTAGDNDADDATRTVGSVSITVNNPGNGDGEDGDGPTTSDLSLTKSVNTSTPAIGATVIYTLSVTNNGPVNASGVVVSDILPTGLTFVSTSTADIVGVYSTTTGKWNIGTLVNATTATLHISATVNTGMGGILITNTASTTNTNGDNNTENNTSAVSITPATPSGGGGEDRTPPVTPPVPPPTGGGGGGNGPIAGSFGGGGGNGPIVQSGLVLGASSSSAPADCNKYLTSFIRSGRDNDSSQVTRLQWFLNNFEGNNLTINGIYDAPTLAALLAFQAKYSSQILTPWRIGAPTGFVYLTTRKTVNNIYCHGTKTFPLTSDEQAIVDRGVGIGDSGHSSSKGTHTSNTEPTTPTGNSDSLLTAPTSSSTPSGNPLQGIGNFFQRLFHH